jgi:hypothetical protein
MSIDGSHKPFDLVVLDLDGTILDLYRSTAIGAAVQEAIAAVQAAGIPVTIGTGRTLDSTRKHIAHLGITTPVITTQGAVIGDPVSGRVLMETDIPLPLARQAADWIDRSPYITSFYFNDADGHTRVVQNRDGPDHDFYDHVFGAPRALQPRFSDLLADENARPPLKFLLINDPAAEDGSGGDVAPELRARFSPSLYITRTHPWLVEGTAQGVTKGEGLRRLCQMLGVNPRRVLAIGDSDNDIPLLEAAGYAVAMGNATPGVKAVADWVAPPIEEDGAVAALQRLVLSAFSDSSTASFGF